MSLSNIVSIAPPLVDQDLVKLADRLMTEVKAGRITAIAYVALTQGGGTEQAWCGNCSLTTMTGAAHELALTVALASVSNINVGK